MHESTEAVVGESTPFEMGPEILTVSDICCAYGERQVLAGLSFSLGRGEILGFLGPNGSGKSTMLGVLTGLVAHTSGTIQFGGESHTDCTRRFRAEMGVIFQSPALDAKLTCRQNLVLAAQLRAIPGSEIKACVDRELLFSGLVERADEAVATLSGGMRRRLDLARALIHRPGLLLMDEPTTGLDEAAFRATWDRLEERRREQDLSILVATHRPEEAERCDRILIIADGRLVVSGTPGELKDGVAADIIEIEAEDPDSYLEFLNQQSSAMPEIGNVTRVGTDSLIHVECERGHELIPRIVEAGRDLRLRSISLRKPSLGDVFLKHTGQNLAEDEE
tara:strand:- start:1531 stop:2535 length:1005 start_codon:yes stop_codon:yes gene_type:complete